MMFRLKHLTTVLLGATLSLQMSGQTELKTPSPSHLFIKDSSKKQDVFLHEVKISGKQEHHGLQLLKTTNQSTEEHLSQINGLNLIRRGNYAAEPSFRGLNSGQTQVTIDGMKIFGACTDKMDPVTSYVASNNLGKACMDQNGDCNASCNMASLDLRTKNLKLNKKSVNGSFSSGYNSNGNGILLSGEINFTNLKNGLRIQSFYNQFDNYQAGGGETINYTQFEKWNGSVLYKRKINASSFFEFNYIADRAYNIGYPALPMDVSYAGGDILSAVYKNHINKTFLKSLKVKAYMNSIVHIMDDTKRDNVYMHMDMPGTSKTIGAFAILNYQFGQNQFNIKPEYYWHNAYAEMTMYPPEEAEMFMLTWPDVNRSTKAFSVFHNNKISEKYRMNNSLLFEHQSNTVLSNMGIQQLQAIGYEYDNAINRIAYQAKSQSDYTWNKKQSSFAKVAVTQRNPNVSEAFGYYLFNSLDLYDYIGNPNLENEQSLQLELGHRVKFKKLHIEAGMYHYGFKNYIIGLNTNLDGMTYGAKGVREYSNIKTAQIYGAEMKLAWQINSKISFKNQSNYTVGKNHQRQALPLIPSLKSTSQLNYIHKKFDLSAQWIYSAEQNQFAEYYGETFTPEYNLLDLTLKYPFGIAKKQLDFAFTIQNLMDVKYADHLDWNKIPRPGRSFNFSLNYPF